MNLDTIFQQIQAGMPVDALKEIIAEKITSLTAQRLVNINTTKKLLTLLEQRATFHPENAVDQYLSGFIHALKTPTSGALKYSSVKEYRDYLHHSNKNVLKKESAEAGEIMQKTGLVSRHHAVLLRAIANEHPILLDKALGLSSSGKKELFKHMDFVLQLIIRSASPETPQSVYGLAKVLDRQLLSGGQITDSLKRLLGHLSLHPEVHENLLQHGQIRKLQRSPQEILVADTLNILGQPLGISQGRNQTCQTIRAISLWSLYAPEQLMKLLIEAVQTNNITFYFEGNPINSGGLQEGVAEIKGHDDALSQVLVPHLDKIYQEMMRIAGYRGEDPHKWVNPAFYGSMVPPNFKSAFNYSLNNIIDYDSFIQLFYATHHPDYNQGNLFLPNPVGIFSINPEENSQGFHAITILRVAKDKEDNLRIYFYNPDKESREDWGQGIIPRSTGNGEIPGESSLPFYQLASRIYAFHYGDFIFDDELIISHPDIELTEDLARHSWGKAYLWHL